MGLLAALTPTLGQAAPECRQLIENASVAYGQGEFAAGAAALLSGKEGCSENGQWLFWQGRLSMRAGDLGTALEAFQRLRRLEPRNASAAKLMADVHLRKGDRAAAIGVLTAALGDKPDDSLLLAALDTR